MKEKPIEEVTEETKIALPKKIEEKLIEEVTEETKITLPKKVTEKPTEEVTEETKITLPKKVTEKPTEEVIEETKISLFKKEERKPEEETKITLKKKVPKEIEVTEVEVTLKAEKPVEKTTDKTLFEEISVSLTTQKESKEEMVEETKTVIISKKEKPEHIEEHAVIKTKKKPIVKEEVKVEPSVVEETAEFVIKPKAESVVAVEEHVVIRPQPDETKPEETLEEEFKVTIPQKEKPKIEEITEEYAKITIGEKEKPYKVEEEVAEVTVKKPIIVEKKVVEEKTAAVTLKKKKKVQKEEEVSAISEVLQMKPELPKEEPLKDVTLTLKPLEETTQPEEESVEESFAITIPQKIKEEKPEPIEETAKVLLKRKEEQYLVTEEAVGLTVKKEVIIEEEEETVSPFVKEEKPEEKVTLKTKPKKRVEPIEEVKVQLKPIEKKPEEIQEETFALEIPKKTEKTIEHIEETLKLQELKVEEKKYTVVEESVKVTVKKEVEQKEEPVKKEEIVDTKVVKKRKTPKKETDEVILTEKIKLQKKPEEKIESPEETFAISLPQKEKPSEEEVEETFALTIPRKPEETAAVVAESTERIVLEEIKKEYTVSEEAAEITVKKEIIIEEDVEEKAVIKRKKIPKKKEEQEDAMFKIKLDKKPEEIEKPKDTSVEEEFSIKMPKKELKPTETLEESIKITLPKEDKREYKIDEAEAEITVKKEVIVEEIPEKEKSPEAVEKVKIPKPKKEKEITLKLKPEKEEPEIVEKIKLTKPREPKKPESPTEESFVIPLAKVEEPVLEETFAVNIPKKVEKPEEIPEETFQLTIEKKEPKEYKVKDVAAEITIKKEILVDEDELIAKKVEEEKISVFKQQEVEIKKKEEKRITKEKKETVEVTQKLKLKKKPEIKPTEEPVEESFKIPLLTKDVKEETSVEEIFALELPEKPKKPVEVIEESLKLTVKAEKPVKQEVVETVAEQATVILPGPEIIKEIEEVTVVEKVTKKEEKEEKTTVKIKHKKKEAEFVEEYKIKRKPEEKKPEEPVEESFQIPLAKKPMEETPVEESFVVEVPRKKEKPREDAEEQLKITLPEKRERQYKVTDETAEVTIKKEVPVDIIEEREEKVTVVKKKVEVKKKEEIREEFKIVKRPEPKEPEETTTEKVIKLPKKLKEEKVTEEEDSLKLKIPEKKPTKVISEESAEITVKKVVEEEKVSIKKDKKEIQIQEEKLEFAVKRPKKKVEPIETPAEESFTIRRKPEDEPEAPKSEDVEESFAIAAPKRKPKYAVDEEEAASIRIPAEKPKYKTEEVSEETKVVIEKPKVLQEERIEKIQEDLEMIAMKSYIAEKTDTISLVEGERVYLIKKTSSDWWFVKKVLTNETGLIPAQFVQDSDSYTHYMKETLDKKIEKLPILHKPRPGEKMGAPKFVKKLQSVRVIDGQTVKLSCQVTGVPRPTVTWFRQTAIMKPSEEFQIFYDDDNVTTLIITEVFPEDAGTFTVVAKNSSGFASCSAELIVEAPFSDHGSEITPLSRRSLSRQSSLADILEGIPPVFSEKPKDRTVDEGKSVELICKVTGVPEPKITWFHKKKIVKETNRTEIKTLTEDLDITTVILTIKNVKPEDEGPYEIRAENKEGKSVTSLNLKVKEKKKPKGEPPAFSETYKDVVKTEKDVVTLTVKVQGTPQPEVTWFKNGKQLKPSKTIKQTQEKDVCTLVISESVVGDSGEYKCVAINPEGKTEHTAKVTVQKPEKPKGEPPTFTQTYSDLITTEKDVVSLTVKVLGTPPPAITWFKNGKQLKPSKTIKQTQEKDVCTLVISESNVGDSGEYKCVATNPEGKTEHTAKVTVQKTGVEFVDKLNDVEVKERETAMFVTQVSQTDAEVTWHKDGEQIKESKKFQFVKEGKFRKLVINDASVNEEGEYTCVLGEQECTADLVVVELPPDFKGEMNDVTIAKEETATFQVELTKGDARARWFKNGKEIQFSEHVLLKIDGKRQKLMIYNATFEDAGTYTCVVGDKKRTAKLKVEAPTVEFTAKLPEKVTVPQDTDATFTVELSRPDVDIEWLKDGKPVRKDDTKFCFIRDKNVFKMVVQGVSKDDSAEYTCVAGNVKTSTKLQVQEASAEFTLKLRDVLVRESDTAILLVEVTRETFEVRWMKDGQMLTQTERMVMEREGCRRRLIIKETVLDDKGMYTCVMEEKMCSSTLTVEATPRVVTERRQFSCKRGSNLSLGIEFVALPPPKVEWFCKGKSISSSKKHSIENYKTKTVLSVKKLEDADVGSYTLKLSNKCGECTTEFVVSIIDKPRPPGTPTASEIADDSLTLSWKAPESDGGSPIINYIIEFHDRNTLRWSIHNEKFTITDTFRRVTNLKAGEEYMFRIIAVNEVGKSDPSPGTKYILVREPRAGEPPAVVQHLQPVTVGLKSPATLTCRISGQPTPDVKWYKNGKEVFILKNVTSTYENQIATLKIAETTEKTSGSYSCRATNSLGTVETTADLKIQEPPRAEFEEKMKNVRLKSTSEYLLTVKVFGYPQPEIRWQKNGTPLESTKHTLVQERENSTTITIRSVQNTDSGLYTLELINSSGTEKYDFRLFVLDKPLPPQGPIAFQKIERDSVTLSWQQPAIGGSEVLSYIIEKCETKRKVFIEVTSVSSEVLSCCAKDLTEGTDYIFRVLAVNEYGRSEPLTSEPVTPRSLFQKPLPPKGPFTTSNMTATSFTLSWLAPDSDGGTPLLEYVVEKKEVNKKAWQRVGSTDGRSLSMEVTGLKKDTAYNFRVSCRNEVGTSPPFSPEETITAGLKIAPPSSPVGPLAVVHMTNKTLTLAWKAPSHTGGADLTAYIVEKRESHKKAWNRLETLDPHITSYTVHNLSDKYEYFFRVFAENLAGLSPPLETEKAIRLTSTAERPTPPTAPLEMLATGPSSIVIEWGKPESDGGAPLLGYTVALRDVRRIMWMEVGQVDAETQRLQIRDLQEGHEYLVRIMARNEVGISDPLESEEPVKVIRPPGFKEAEQPEVDERTVSLSFSTETSSSWIREANVEPLLRSYTKHVLVGRNEYFFRIWHYAESLFK